MELLKPIIKDYPGRHSKIEVDDPDLDFFEARGIARQGAKNGYRNH